jgi:hypothetical protein
MTQSGPWVAALASRLEAREPALKMSSATFLEVAVFRAEDSQALVDSEALALSGVRI